MAGLDSAGLGSPKGRGDLQPGVSGAPGMLSGFSAESATAVFAHVSAKCSDSLHGSQISKDL